MWSSRTACLPRSANACLIHIPQSLNAFQKYQFPFHAIVPVISAPENERKPGRETECSIPKELNQLALIEIHSVCSRCLSLK